MALSFKQIEVFRSVITTGSISGGAKLLCVSQPAVSRLLSYTEQRLGFALFERVKGRLYPTPEAHELFREIERAYDGIQRVNALAASLGARPSGEIRIVCGASVGQSLVPKAIGRFRERYADVKVTFRQTTHAELTRALLDKDAEIGLQITDEDHPNLSYTRVGQAELVCICPADHPLTRRGALTLADLAPYALVSYPPHMPMGASLDRLYIEAGLHRKVAVDVASPQHACSMVQAGVGIALVDEFSVHSRRAGEFVVRPLVAAPLFVAKLVHLRSDPLSRLAAAFVAVLRETLDDDGLGLATMPESAPASVPVPKPVPAPVPAPAIDIKLSPRHKKAYDPENCDS